MRREQAGETQGELRNLTRDQVLACMGRPPHARITRGDLEVLQYGPPTASGGVERAVEGLDRRLGDRADPPCTVDVGIRGGWVSDVRYTDPQGRPLRRTGQCAVAVQNCMVD